VSAKPVVSSKRARRDIDEAVAHHLTEGAVEAALDFVDALERAFTQLGCQPGMGSPRHAHELNLPGLRCWSLKRYPHLVFYVECDDRLDVWRVLHGRKDIPLWMQEPGPV
jgi:toxin ParE1/3/4